MQNARTILYRQGKPTSISIRPIPMTSYLTTIGIGSVLPGEETDKDDG